MTELAARAYDIGAWRLCRPHLKLNFMEIESREVAEFMGPPVNIASNPVKRVNCSVLKQQDTWESDTEAMARFARENS